MNKLKIIITQTNWQAPLQTNNTKTC